MAKPPPEEEPIPSMQETVRDIFRDLAIWAVLLGLAIGAAVLFGIQMPWVAP